MSAAEVGGGEASAEVGQQRRFILERENDVSGVSGTGLVAEGVEFSDGSAAIRWVAGDHRSTVIWADVASVEAIHGHGGATRIVWLDGRTHGYESTYRAGCRCEACANAMSGRRHKARQRHNAESMDTATHRGQQWTGPELEAVTREDLTAREAAKLLGRTVRAVENMRHRCRTEPKYAQLAGVSIPPEQGQRP